MPDLPGLTAIILAGGQSSRMGQDKGLLQLQGTTLIAHVARAAAQVCTQLLLVSRNPDHCDLGLPVVADEEPGLGPAAGILSGLRHSGSDHNLVLSCDIPFIHPAILQRLLERCEGHPVTIAQSRGQVHPLIGVYHKACIPHFEAALEAGERKLRKIIFGLEAKVVDLDQEMPDHDPQWLLNINTRDELAAVLRESL